MNEHVTWMTFGGWIAEDSRRLPNMRLNSCPEQAIRLITLRTHAARAGGGDVSEW